MRGRGRDRRKIEPNSVGGSIRSIFLLKHDIGNWVGQTALFYPFLVSPINGLLVPLLNELEDVSVSKEGIACFAGDSTNIAIQSVVWNDTGFNVTLAEPPQEASFVTFVIDPLWSAPSLFKNMVCGGYAVRTQWFA